MMCDEWEWLMNKARRDCTEGGERMAIIGRRWQRGWVYLILPASAALQLKLRSNRRG
jgi:hypothetical protein